MNTPLSAAITRVLAGTCFGYCLMTAVLGRPASIWYFLVCLIAATLGVVVAALPSKTDGASR